MARIYVLDIAKARPLTLGVSESAGTRVSAVNLHLVASDLAVSEHGTHVRKGIPDQWRLFAVMSSSERSAGSVTRLTGGDRTSAPRPGASPVANRLPWRQQGGTGGGEPWRSPRPSRSYSPTWSVRPRSATRSVRTPRTSCSGPTSRCCVEPLPAPEGSR